MFDNRHGYYNDNPWNPRNNINNNARQQGYGGAGWGRQQQGQPARGRPRNPAGSVGLRWKEHLWTAALAAASLCVWYVTPVSHWVTDALLWQVPIEEDVMLGRQALQDGFAFKYPTVYDHHYTPLLQSIGHDLVRTYRREQQTPQQSLSRSYQNSFREAWLTGGGGGRRGRDPHEWDFAVVQSDSINAFALPGGIVRVTSALLQALRPTHGELAALVGHEMGHVLHRHSQARILQRQLLANVLQAVVDGYYTRGDGYIPGDRRRSRKTESFGSAIGNLLLQSAQWLGDQKFSRRDEYQADAVAWDLLLASDAYNPQSVISLLAKLERQEQRHVASTKASAAAATSGSSSRGITSAIEEWTRTHPATSDRLQALEKKWKDLPAQERRRLQNRRAA